MAQSEPERTFTLFPELPQEIRLMIWECALPGPRVVDIRQRQLSMAMDGFRSSSRTPAVFRACQESFRVARKRYCRALSTGTTLAKLYFDFKIDTLYLQLLDHEELPRFMSSLMRLWGTNNLNEVEKLAILLEKQWLIPFRWNILERRLAEMFAKYFPSLKRFMLVLRDHRDEAGVKNGASTDMVLMEPIDLDQAFKDYENTASRYPGSWINFGCYGEIRLRFEWARLDVSAIARHMSQQPNNLGFSVGENVCTMPEIRTGIAVSRRLKDKLDILRERLRKAWIEQFGPDVRCSYNSELWI